MDAIVFYMSTALLMVLMIKSGSTLIGRDSLRGRPIPWAAVILTALALVGVIVQLAWSPAMGLFNEDPAKTGWWRVFTAVFMQNGGFAGAAWNIATLAIVAAFASWLWGSWLTIALFLAGILLPERIDALFGLGGGSNNDPRDFAGSSGATYFLGASLALGLLMNTKVGKLRILALSVPVVGLAMWLVQENGHGMVAAYGFVVAIAAWAIHRAFNRSGSRRAAPSGR